MSAELQLHGKQYVSSKRAAEQTGYARDYIGQLARSGQIDAERVGGLWYVSLESLEGYEKNAETARSFSPVSATQRDNESALTFEGKEYISASRASKLIGYNQDYIGQLARSGKIPSRQIGNRWYVDRDSLVQHKSEKDALLAAVQSQAVGLSAPEHSTPVAQKSTPEHILVLPPLTYVADTSDLIPHIAEKKESPYTDVTMSRDIISLRANSAPSSVYVAPLVRESVVIDRPKAVKRSKRRVIRAGVGVLTIILVLSVGFAGVRNPQVFAAIGQDARVQNVGAAAASAIGSVGDIIEDWVSPLLVYERGM